MSTPNVLTVLEAADTLRCSRARVFELLADGTLVRARSFGRRTVIIAESVFNALEGEYHPAPKTKRVRVSGPLAARFDAAWENAQEKKGA